MNSHGIATLLRGDAHSSRTACPVSRIRPLSAAAVDIKLAHNNLQGYLLSPYPVEIRLSIQVAETALQPLF